MKENFSLEEIDARFYSALAEFERLISRGVLSLVSIRLRTSI